MSAPSRPPTAAGSPVGYLKGHGTGNDFVVLPDPDDRLTLTPELVRAICDRRYGVGADGVLRVAPGQDGGWFMDHRNADGSTAEMCGNGLRLFARYLTDSGLADGGAELRIGTRAGVRRATVRPDGGVRVEMGAATVGAGSSARVGDRSFPGTAVSMGNPHLVCPTDVPVADLDLSSPPAVDPSAFPGGVNVEFVNVLAAGPGDGVDVVVRMRVHERGVGETQACGTGACAVAATALAGRPGVAAVDQPGGRVLVEVTADGCWLTGPTVVVATGELDPEWLTANS